MDESLASGSGSDSGGEGCDGSDGEGMRSPRHSSTDSDHEEHEYPQHADLNLFFLSRGRKARRNAVDYRVYARATITAGAVFDLALERRLDAALVRFNKARVKKHRRMRKFLEWERRKRARFAEATAAKVAAATARAAKSVSIPKPNELPNETETLTAR